MASYTKALEKYGSVRKACQAMGVKRSTFFDRLNKEKLQVKNIQHLGKERTVQATAKKVTKYIFTAAVKGAVVHEDFLANLKAYAAHIGAELVIGALTNAGRQRFAQLAEEDFADSLLDFITDEPISIGDNVKFCPELNLTPTMVRPLQGLQTYTKRAWGVFPHTKISLETVATHKERPTKFNFTTGAVTHPHYTPTKAGYRAHFDHMHGACVVEVTKQGAWVRHVTPKSEIDGTFYDLDLVVESGKVKTHDGVPALVYGDIHVEHLDQKVAAQTWGLSPLWSTKINKSLAGILKPKTQVFHDLMDMTAENYHELDDLFARCKNYVNHDDNVQLGFNTVRDFIQHVAPLATNNIVVESNHDYFIKKWLLKFDPAQREDFGNIVEYYKLKAAVLTSIMSTEPYSLLELSMRTMLPEDETTIDKFKFLLADESYEIENIECGWHGHLGPNGRRGSKIAFKFVTEKSIIGHMHSPSIESGCHVVGTSSRLNLSYNAGPSSWAQTHGIIYPHGGRTLVTMSDGKFWADQPVAA